MKVSRRRVNYELVDYKKEEEGFLNATGTVAVSIFQKNYKGFLKSSKAPSFHLASLPFRTVDMTLLRLPRVSDVVGVLRIRGRK